MTTLCAGVGGRLIDLGEIDAVAPLSLGLAYDNGDVEIDLVEIGVTIGVQAQQQVQAQIQPAIGGTVFVTPFGDAPGVVQIAFIANKECEDEFAGQGISVIQHYFNRRAIPRQAGGVPIGPAAGGLPAIIVIGNNTFRAFLTGLQLSASTSDTPLIQGSLIFTAWPLS